MGLTPSITRRVFRLGKAYKHHGLELVDWAQRIHDNRTITFGPGHHAALNRLSAKIEVQLLSARNPVVARIWFLGTLMLLYGTQEVSGGGLSTPLTRTLEDQTDPNLASLVPF